MIHFSKYKELIELYYAGLSRVDIAKRLGASKNEVSNALLKLAPKRRSLDLQKQGEKHSQAKLSNENVKEIRSLLINGANVKHIAQFYGVSHWTIISIKKGKSWKSLK